MDFKKYIQTKSNILVQSIMILPSAGVVNLFKLMKLKTSASIKPTARCHKLTIAYTAIKWCKRKWKNVILHHLNNQQSKLDSDLHIVR